MRLCRILIKMADAFSHLRGGTENHTVVQEETASASGDETGALSNRLLPTDPICCQMTAPASSAKLVKILTVRQRCASVTSRRDGACLLVGE
jgi:hypothetical protein